MTLTGQEKRASGTARSHEAGAGTASLPMIGSNAGSTPAPRSTVLETSCRCSKPRVVRMDFESHGAEHVNRQCLSCGAHWYGPAGEVQQYTRAEWDRVLEAA